VNFGSGGDSGGEIDPVNKIPGGHHPLSRHTTADHLLEAASDFQAPKVGNPRHVDRILKRFPTSSDRSTNEALHSPSSGTPSSDAFFGGSGNTTPSVTSPPPHGHYSGFSSPMTFSPPMSPPPLQPALPLPPSVRLKQPHGNVFAPASEANAATSSLSHQVIYPSCFPFPDGK